ncbi:MAG: VWA domain-containing protein [Lachnospiraceae bacterium]|nr:VWA domain-containing protein [Lachnospiraceae bacterium]
MKKVHAAFIFALATVLSFTSGCGIVPGGTAKKDNSVPAAETAEASSDSSFAVFDEEVEYEPDGVLAEYAMPAMAMAVSAKASETEIRPGNDDFNTEEYDYTTENPFRLVRTAPFSTFAADVDTASYANMRRQILNGGSVVPDSVRIEELINYFHYDYPEPSGEEPFSVTFEIADCPWNGETLLMLIGLKAKEPDKENMPQSNLVFLIDVSGSMDEKNKLPLVQRSFMTLAENLDEDDRISVVTYSSGEEVVLDGVPAGEKSRIMSAIEDLQAYGSTNGEKALEMAYEIAEKNYIKNGNNRIIMATDGDFNVGITSEGELVRLIQEKAKGGISLSVLGYGMGNYKDNKLEALADHGRGNYAYIDSIDEARKVLVEEAGGTLFTVAKDVKLQVEFNPAAIKGYRLIGYENRAMAAEEFADDTKAGGEIGAGHEVTVLYELVPTGSSFEIPGIESKYTAEIPENGSDEFLTLNIRYKEPDEDESRLLSYPVSADSMTDVMSDNMSWAAGTAQAGMLMKGSAYAGTSSIAEIRERLKPISTDDFRDEFLYLLRKYSAE